MNLSKIPEKYRLDIEKAVFCLKEEGCTSIFLFGSLATGKYTDSSDIDFGVMGLPPRKYIRTCSKLSNIMENEFDLVDFDENKGLYNLLHSIGEIVEIG
ncbi:MAG: nucleotidyltransferase domain-containing protein [Leptospirales bacterium]|nr:nucleotidyltransferase domain-containing protein [Leptospirales bacterium]